MGAESHIQWTDATWNIARGCTKVDEDCKNCYMYRDSMGSTRYNPLQVVRTKTVFNLPLKLKVPSKIFTCSLTDFFHEAIDSYRHEAWDIIRKCPQHTFQILTKRPERIMECLPADWGDGWDNVWLGTSMGSNASHMRLYDLLKVPAKTRFLSLEPLFDRIDFYEISDKWPHEGHPWRDMPILTGIHWVVIGGESGNEIGKYRYRPCQVEWIERLMFYCKTVGVPVFVKQLGTYLSTQLSIERHGGNIEQWPMHLRVREFPKVKIDYQAEVLKVYPAATAKHWAFDNGHGVSSFWSISKDNICITYTPDRYISSQMKTAKEAWENAYNNIKSK